MKESDICEPNSAYGISKLASTLYASDFANRMGKPIINVRLFSPFGPFDDPARLITYASINAIEGNALELANPYAERDYIYVGDVDSDDTESEEIDLYINGVKKLILPVKLHYYDANNMEYDQKVDLEINPNKE